MSLSEQISRVVGGHNGALRELLKQLGADVPDSEKADYFPSAAASIGNRLKPSSLLSDSTKSLYGLPSTSTPDNVLSWIGKYNTHWWSELHGEAGIGYEEVRTDISSSMDFTRYYGSMTYTCSKSISINQSTGAITQVSPTTVTLSGVPSPGGSTNYADAVAEVNKILSLAPVYVKGFEYHDDEVFYFPAGSNAMGYHNTGSSSATVRVDYDDENGWAYLVQTGAKVCAKLVTSKKYNIPAGDTVYVNSTKRNAYPDNGAKNGLTYRYLGNPFENSVKSISIERGQYVGTGLYGESNPSSITFKRIPQLLFIHTTEYLLDKNVFVDCTKIADGTTYTSIPSLGSARFSGNTLYWYSSSASSQLNSSQVLYYYTSIY